MESEFGERYALSIVAVARTSSISETMYRRLLMFGIPPKSTVSCIYPQDTQESLCVTASRGATPFRWER